MKSLAILSSSGHGRVVAETAELCGWETIVFFDDAYPAIRQNLCWSVLGTLDDLIQRMNEFHGVFVAIGHNATRLEKLRRLISAGANLVTLIHPFACVSRYAQIGEGSAVLPGAIINANARVGAGVILNTQSSVDHDCRLGDGVHISPGARLGGNVEIGDRSWVGIGASIRHGIRIGADAVVGAGAAVTRDVPDHVTAVGVPARVRPSGGSH